MLQPNQPPMQFVAIHSPAEHPILCLQRTAGNRVVLSLMRRRSAQPAARENRWRPLYTVARPMLSFGIYLLLSVIKSLTQGKFVKGYVAITPSQGFIDTSFTREKKLSID